tara:strand:+ start:175 stop:420 length:246 start_codon:yes stop_codon:yes gene_type:complete
MPLHEIASNINTLMMMTGTNINTGAPKTTSKFMNANSIDSVLDFAVDTIMALLPENDRKEIYKILGKDVQYLLTRRGNSII